MSANVKIGAGAGAKPWWIGGHEDRGQWNQLPANVTSKEMLVLAGVNHEVGKSPLFTFASKEDYVNRKMSRLHQQYAMVKKHPGGQLEVMPGIVVGEDYTPIQVQDMFAFGDDVLNASKEGEMPAHWETAGELLDGTIFATAKIDTELYIAGDEIKAYFFMTTRHDGKTSFRIKDTHVRAVCANTCAMALRDGTKRDFSIRHTQNFKTRIEEARQVMKFTTKAHAEFEKLALQLLATPLPMKSLDFKQLMEHMFPTPETLTGLENVNAQRVGFMRVLANTPDLSNIRDTGWGVVQAAADYEQHHKQIRSQDENKVLETLFKRSFNSDTNSSLVTKAKEFVLAL